MKIGRREGKLDLFSMLPLQDVSFRATGKVEAALKGLSHGSNESEAILIFRIFPLLWLVILMVTLTCRLNFPHEAEQRESLVIIFQR